MRLVDCIIKNGFLLRIDENDSILPNTSLVIHENKILDFGSDDHMKNMYQSDHIIDAKGCFVMPGFINAHTHLPMTYFRGLADDLPLKVWLENYIWPNEARFLSPEFVYDAALHGCAELIKNGITLFNDMYFYGREIAKASIKAGMKAIISEVALDYSVANCHNSEENFNYLIENIQMFKNNPLIDFSIGPHSVYACSTDTLKKCKAQADKLNCLVHMHLSETEFEVNHCLQNFKLRPVDYLNDLGLLDNRLIIAHGVWLNDSEINLLKKKNVSVILNTESNMKLASGFAPVYKYCQADVNLCLGTDSVASNNNLSMFDEMCLTAKIHKCLNSDPSFLTARDIIHMATIQSAKALGKDNECGSIEIGKNADIIILNSNSVESYPYYHPYSHIVYCMNQKNVQTVIIHGKTVMENGSLTTLDENDILNKASYYQNKIKEGL